MPRTPECTARNHQITELVAHGYTQQEVADKFGISQQRVDQISKRDVRRKVAEAVKNFDTKAYSRPGQVFE